METRIVKLLIEPPNMWRAIFYIFQNWIRYSPAHIFGNVPVPLSAKHVARLEPYKCTYRPLSLSYRSFRENYEPLTGYQYGSSEYLNNTQKWVIQSRAFEIGVWNKHEFEVERVISVTVYHIQSCELKSISSVLSIIRIYC